MRNFEEANAFIQMIENGMLINREEIKERYQVTDDDLDTLVSNRQISSPEKKFETEWYLEKEIELLFIYWRRED